MCQCPQLERRGPRCHRILAAAGASMPERALTACQIIRSSTKASRSNQTGGTQSASSLPPEGSRQDAFHADSMIPAMGGPSEFEPAIAASAGQRPKAPSSGTEDSDECARPLYQWAGGRLKSKPGTPPSTNDAPGRKQDIQDTPRTRPAARIAGHPQAGKLLTFRRRRGGQPAGNNRSSTTEVQAWGP
jgi:hypothetical protein